MRAGRFRVKCVRAEGIRKKGQAIGATRIDAYVKLKLGNVKKAEWAKSDTVKRANENPHFNDQELSFDLIDPMQVVKDGDIRLSVELWDDNAWESEQLANLDMSVVRFMQRPGEWHVEELPITNAAAAEMADKRGHAKIHLSFMFEEARVGMVAITLYEGSGIENQGVIGKQDPYVKLTMGDDYTKRTKTCADGGSSPYFGEQELLMWVNRAAWVNHLNVECWDEDIGNDDLMGKTAFSLLPYMSVPYDQAAAEDVQLWDPSKEPMLEPQRAAFGVGQDFNEKAFTEKTEDFARRKRGQLSLRVGFMPAGVLTIKCLSAKNLKNLKGGGEGRLDPYCVFTTDGLAIKASQKTKVDTDGGVEPQWNSELKMDIVDQYALMIECFNHELLGSDKVLGKANVSLLPVFKKGYVDAWVTLKAKDPTTKIIKEVGEVHIRLEFNGPHGIAYPQNQPSVDSFDDTNRIQVIQQNLKQAKEDTLATKEEGGKELALVAPEDDDEDLVRQVSVAKSTEFSDVEIEAAFKFIDLDKNGCIGAAELRHVLVCMGELITDEEIDMMISMVDGDGDGQVGYSEFYELVTDPDPSRPGFGKKPKGGDKKEGGGGDLDAKAHERQKAAQQRDEKRRMLSLFIDDNNIGPAEVHFAYEKYNNMPAEERDGGVIEFGLFCDLLQIEETGEYRKLFGLFDNDGDGTLDIKEFILGLCNFVPKMDQKARTKLVFQLFDEDRSGFLAVDELTKVLMANHMQSADNVAKKAQTILKHADEDGSGTLSLEEFDIIGQKFPNIMFPSFGEAQAAGGA